MKRLMTVKHPGVRMVPASALVRVIGGDSWRPPRQRGGEGPQDGKRPLPELPGSPGIE